MKRLTQLILALAIGITTMAQVTTDVDGDIYSLNFNDIEFQVDASRGAKVRSLKLNGTEFLVQEEESRDYLWGATLWPAPQSSWGWPPENYFPNIEDGLYTAQVSETTMSFESIDEWDMIFTKSFSANESDTSISIIYTMTNTGDSERTNALWELTRPHVNGLTFWPTGPDGTWGQLASSVVEQGDFSWLDIDAETRSELKFFADGADGWFAHVDANRTLFVKTFEDVDAADFADGEGEMELWISGNYIELENLSATKNLQPNEVLTYELKWYVRELPAEISAEVGSTALVNYVRKMLGESPIVSVGDAQVFECTAYPNPAANQIQFNWSQKFGSSAKVDIYDAIGRLQLSAVIDKGTPINIEELKSGVMFYSIKVDDEVVNGRFIKD